MVDVFIGVGSNINPEENIRLALQRLGEEFELVKVSSVYESPAVGFIGPPFLNMVAAVTTGKTLSDVVQSLKNIEAESGRIRGGARFADRTLDLDLLLYGEYCTVTGELELPRPEMIKQAFILKPMAEIAGGRVHPQLGVTYGLLWDQFGHETQTIERRVVKGLL